MGHAIESGVVLARGELAAADLTVEMEVDVQPDRVVRPAGEAAPRPFDTTPSGRRGSITVARSGVAATIDIVVQGFAPSIIQM